MKTVQTIKLSLVREPVSPYPSKVSHAGDIYNLAKSLIGNEPREVILALYLDTRNKVIAAHRVSIGTLDASAVHPREVFGPGLQLSASALILCHNHPSGDPTPSSADRAVTNRIRAAGELLGVPMLDHVVIGECRYYSFAEEKFLAV